VREGDGRERMSKIAMEESDIVVTPRREDEGEGGREIE